MAARSPYTGVVVYTHSSVTAKNLINKYLDLIHDFDAYIGDIYVSQGDVNRSTIQYWCYKNQINFVTGIKYITTGPKNHVNKFVLYIGSTTRTDTFTIASEKARQIGCDLIILP